LQTGLPQVHLNLILGGWGVQWINGGGQGPLQHAPSCEQQAPVAAHEAQPAAIAGPSARPMDVTVTAKIAAIESSSQSLATRCDNIENPPCGR
jgi:hypothetical protein